MMRTAIIPARFRSVILGLLFVTGILLPGPGWGQCDGVKATDRFAIPPYAMWHISQLTDFPLHLEVDVDPACGPVNYVIACQIWKEGGDTIVSISDLESLGMPYCLTLADGLPLGLYVGRYRVTSDLPGDDLSDNEQTFQFVLSNDRFAKEIHGGPLMDISADDLPEGFFGFQYLFSDIDYTGDIDLEYFEVEVGIANADDLVPGGPGGPASIAAILYEWHDLNLDNQLDLGTETVIRGFGQYDFQDGDQSQTLFRFPLFDEDFNEGVPVQEDTRYILVAIPVAPENASVLPRFLISQEFDYTVTDSLNIELVGGGTLPGCAPQLGGGWLNSQLIGSVWLPVGDTIPVIRLVLPPKITTSTTAQKVEIQMKVGILNGALLVEWFGNDLGDTGILSVTTTTGYLAKQQKIDLRQSRSMTIPLEGLPPGLIFLTYESGAAIFTSKMLWMP